MKVYESSINVTAADLDDLHHVNNVVYLRWAQDAAKNHWQDQASKSLTSKYVWMVLRHEIDYAGQALLGDELTVRTWVAWSEGVKSERLVEIIKTSNQKTIVNVKTLWCLLDAQTKKPARIAPAIREIFQ